MPIEKKKHQISLCRGPVSSWRWAEKHRVLSPTVGKGSHVCTSELVTVSYWVTCEIFLRELESILAQEAEARRLRGWVRWQWALRWCHVRGAISRPPHSCWYADRMPMDLAIAILSCCKSLDEGHLPTWISKRYVSGERQWTYLRVCEASRPALLPSG